MNERLQGIEAFAAAVEAGSFALAAERLHRTRSAVGKSIARLEARLGTRLFHRTTRSQSLTEDGEAYYERCRRALAELDAADAELEAGRQEPVGKLRISMPAVFGRVCVAPLLLELGQRHPGLAFDLRFGDRLVDLVDEGLDLAIRSGTLEDSSVLAARPLGRQWVGLFAAPAYLERHGRPRDWDALRANAAAHAFVGYARDGWPKPWPYHDAQGRLANFALPARFSFDSLEVIAMAAAAGLGIVRLPWWLAAGPFAQGTLVPVFDEPRPFGYELHAIWPRVRALPCRTRIVIDALVAGLPAMLAGPAPYSSDDESSSL
jgi:DNA-binding transcriptional LysR family regulator